MEKRRVGTRFMDREVTEEDQAKPLIEGNGLYINPTHWFIFERLP